MTYQQLEIIQWSCAMLSEYYYRHHAYHASAYFAKIGCNAQKTIENNFKEDKYFVEE